VTTQSLGSTHSSLVNRNPSRASLVKGCPSTAGRLAKIRRGALCSRYDCGAQAPNIS